MGADDIAILRARHRADDRPAFTRSGCAPVDWEVVLGTRCRVRGKADMINPIWTSHRNGPPEMATARLSRRAWSPTMELTPRLQPHLEIYSYIATEYNGDSCAAFVGEAHRDALAVNSFGP